MIDESYMKYVNVTVTNNKPMVSDIDINSQNIIHSKNS